jgi:hypothetical protein
MPFNKCEKTLIAGITYTLVEYKFKILFIISIPLNPALKMYRIHVFVEGA